MASHVAASAFGYCLALVRDEEAATRLAITAVRTGGRTLGGVLGHARAQALAHLAAHPPGPERLPAGAGPSEVAWALARTRPPAELAMIDLGGRYGLTRSGLGIALRLTPGAAVARVAAVGQAWDAGLNPALLAWLGPGECDWLAAALGGAPRDGPEQLVALGRDVSAHAGGCAACADRLRALTPVRLLVTGTPLPSPPPSVAAAATGSRLQPPAPPPPVGPRRARRGLRAAAGGVAVLAVGGVAATGVDARRHDDRRAASLHALTRLPAVAGSLQLTPAAVRLPARTVDLANRSGAEVVWEAATDAPWLDVAPERGRLAAGATQRLHFEAQPPEGEVRATVTVSGDDGSAASATVEGTVEQPPDLGASASGCRVTAVVEDEGEVALTLHWRSPAGEQTSLMSAAATGLVADLPAGAGPLTWWVSAIDGRGNQARTPDVALPAGC